MPHAHLIVLFNRVCKLLYHRVKPVFVFDGATPALKQKTLVRLLPLLNCGVLDFIAFCSIVGSPEIVRLFQVLLMWHLHTRVLTWVQALNRVAIHQWMWVESIWVGGRGKGDIHIGGESSGCTILL